MWRLSLGCHALNRAVNLFRILTNLMVLLTICGFAPQVWAGFWGGEEQCDVMPTPSSMTWLNMTDVSDAAEQAVEPCSQPEAGSDPSSAVCFVEAGNPISTIPELLAAMQAERAVQHVLRSARLLPVPEPENEPTMASVAPAPQPRVVRPMRMPTPECSAFDVHCGPEDPIPVLLMVELSQGTGLVSFDYQLLPSYPIVEFEGAAHSSPGLAAYGRALDVDAPPPQRV